MRASSPSLISAQSAKKEVDQIDKFLYINCPMSKSQIKFKNLTEDQTIQIIDLDDYFGDGIPKVTKPLTKLQFVKKHLQEIVDELSSVS